MSRFVVRFLTRSRCHLCDQARPLIERVVIRAGGVVEELDVDSDVLLTRDYGARIPVVLGPDGAVLAEGIIREQELRTALRGLSRR